MTIHREEDDFLARIANLYGKDEFYFLKIKTKLQNQMSNKLNGKPVHHQARTKA